MKISPQCPWFPYQEWTGCDINWRWYRHLHFDETYKRGPKNGTLFAAHTVATFALRDWYTFDHAKPRPSFWDDRQSSWVLGQSAWFEKVSENNKLTFCQRLQKEELDIKLSPKSTCFHPSERRHLTSVTKWVHGFNTLTMVRVLFRNMAPLLCICKKSDTIVKSIAARAEQRSDNVYSLLSKTKETFPVPVGLSSIAFLLFWIESMTIRM